MAVCKPIFIKGKFWGYATALYKEKRLFKPTFNKLDKLGYNYRLSKTFITGGGYQPLSSNLLAKSKSEITFRLGGCSWKMEAARKYAGQMPQEVKSGIFSGVIINTVLAALLLNYLERGRRLAKVVDTDYLTSVMSRQAFDRDVSKYLDKHKGEPSVGALIDIDDFKYINDLYGHVQVTRR